MRSTTPSRDSRCIADIITRTDLCCDTKAVNVKPFLCLLLCGLLLGLPPVSSAAGPALVVAYVDGTTLYVWREGGQPQTIATGTITRPILSPNTVQVIYQSDGTLWITDTNGKPTS